MSPKRVSDKLLKGKSYFDLPTLCKEHDKLVTLRVNVNALLICRDWKKCDRQGEKGCAESYYRDKFQEILRRKQHKKGIEGLRKIALALEANP